jgi:hypothetical protein
VKLSLFADDMILPLEDPKTSTKLPKHHKKLQQSNRIKNQFAKVIAFSIPTMTRM